MDNNGVNIDIMSQKWVKQGEQFKTYVQNRATQGVNIEIMSKNCVKQGVNIKI